VPAGGDLYEMVIFPSTGEVMVVKFDTGGYWASVKDESANKRKRLYMAVHSCFVVGRSEGGGREVVEGDGRGGEGRKGKGRGRLIFAMNCCCLLLLRILSPKALLNCGSDGGCRGLQY
jgi:hypothetical protein